MKSKVLKYDYWRFTIRQLAFCASLYVVWKFFLSDINNTLFPLLEILENKENNSRESLRDIRSVLIEFPFLVSMSALLASVLAYHPSIRLKMETVEEIEAPKSHLLYAIAGTIVGVLVITFGEVVGFIIFGLGGLFRFRTDVGPPKETGRVLLSTLVGLICGLHIPEVGFITTVLVFFLVYYLEEHITYRLFVRGLEGKPLDDAAKEYREALKLINCRVLSERKSTIKSQVDFVFVTRDSLIRDELEGLLRKKVNADVQGILDLETR